MRVQQKDAVEIVTGGAGDAPVFFTCEHASERLPTPWEWPPDDRWLVGTHWAYDIGASDLTRELTEAMGATAMLSRFSRLLVDPNRPLESPDLFRKQAEGHTVMINHNLDAGQKQQRIDRLYRAYHDAVDDEITRSNATVLLSVHTFTPVYEGELRTIEVGVLFADEEELAERMRVEIERTGLQVGMNEPYSGKLGMMYAVEQYGRRHKRRAIEIEVRQDLAVEASVRDRLVLALHASLK